MKSVYMWDSNNAYIPSGNKVVPDDYQLAGNETFDAPVDNQGRGLIMPIKRQNGEWVGATQAEYDQTHQAAPVQPTEGAQAINTLGLQVANLVGQVQALSKSMNELGLQVTKQQISAKTATPSAPTTENGGK